ncbi:MULTISPECIES: ABC transporter permease [Vagococcus]|uniref:ABC transmembrane type-1 domain-containing protein n=1 Tax=Vagococcus teuberi TaxID=519472 RepID=A0A1J0A7I4_9ENTE|nr:MULTISPECIES: ABC transporter permease [Vagococcus]APB31865.1 hypothetical protein BHY08_08570 [Vagococcus teuberi]RHH69991.1 ABC transporter permease [Vagococcus sp. AM17-17]
MRKFKKIKTDKLLLVFSIILILLLLCIVFAPYVTVHDPNSQDIPNKLLKPSFQHILGTDLLGRDIFSRIVFGGRTTILLSILIVISIILGGVIFGSISGMSDGIFDRMIVKICDWLLSLPSEMLSLIMIGILGPSMLTIILALTLVRWPWYIKMIRSEIKVIRSKNYVLFSVGSGKNKLWIYYHHVLRQLLRSIIVYATLDLSTVVMSISALSFLGIGIQPPTPEWGTMLNDAREVSVINPWQMIPPGMVLFLVIGMLNYISDFINEQFYQKN